MADLGEFGAAVRDLEEDSGAADRDTFTFCGEQFTVVGRIPPMLMLQLGAAATGKIEEAEGLAAMWESLRCSLSTPEQGKPPADGEDPAPDYKPADASDFNRFFKLAVSHDAELDDIMRLTFKLFGAQTGRPTKRAPASSPGVSSTSRSSSPSSTHPGLAHLRPVSEVLAG